MKVLIMLATLFSGFNERWYIPYGTIASAGRILVYDSDCDEKIELIFRRYIPNSLGVYFAEFLPPDSWDIYESIYVDSVLVWDIGDFDNDGLSDLVTYGDASGGQGVPIPIISIYESPDSFSYPTQEVWRDTVDIGTVQPICAYDIDRDGIPEIVQTAGEPGQNYYIDFSIYESTGNNYYEVKYQFETPETPTSTIAFGDFDSDGLNEFVMGTIDGQYSIFESPANDNYIPLYVNVQLPTVNIKDCFSVPDADGDGKPEFVLKGFRILSALIDVFIFEAIADNTYEIIKTFTLPGGDYDGGYSEAGDVDGDGVPEIVLEARQNVFIIKAVGNNNFYIWDTLPGHTSGSCVRVTNDIDGNGYNEIVISGNDETRIYEYNAGAVGETASPLLSDVLHLEVYPNPFTTKLDIRYEIPDTRYEITNEHISDISYLTSVSLKIYDATGRPVRQWDYQTIRLSDQVLWDGTDDSGRKLPAGVYFVRLESDGFKQVGEVILLR